MVAIATPRRAHRRRRRSPSATSTTRTGVAVKDAFVEEVDERGLVDVAGPDRRSAPTKRNSTRSPSNSLAGGAGCDRRARRRRRRHAVAAGDRRRDRATSTPPQVIVNDAHPRRARQAIQASAARVPRADQRRRAASATPMVEAEPDGILHGATPRLRQPDRPGRDPGGLRRPRRDRRRTWRL